MNATLLEQLEHRIGSGQLSLPELVVAISRIPYGRPTEQSAEAVVAEWRGTCSTKHLLLCEVTAERWSQHPVELWHRPYRVTRELARRLWGEAMSRLIPRDGLIDVHTFATIELPSGPVAVDVTAPLATWDGTSPTTLQCGPGDDLPAGPDPLASKTRLVQDLCDPRVREPFIAALAKYRVIPEG